MPAVIYAAKSTEDKRGSIPTQLADCRESAEREGHEVVGTYEDEGKSAFKGSRGPGLEAARAHVERLIEHGECELWVQHSDRLARGDGMVAAHLIEYVLWARKLGVRLRSVQDNTTFDDLIHAVLMGERNTEDSRRKSEAVRSGLARTFERGERLGGPVPDGYTLVKDFDEHGKVLRAYKLDPDRVAVVRRMFELSEGGMGDPSIARELNREGYRTRGRAGKPGIPWTRRRVQDTLTNVFYAGRVVIHRGTPEEAVRNGTHPPLIEPERFDRTLAMRATRDRAAGSQRSPKGRPVSSYVLARLAVCGRCGAPMRSDTSSYRRKRKGGTKRRNYVCANVKGATGLCDAPPIDAEVVEPAVIANLDTLLIDFESWCAQIETGHTHERTALERGVERAERALVECEQATSRLRARYEQYDAAGDERRAEAVLDMLLARREDVTAAGRRLTAARDALASMPEAAPMDHMLDFFNALREAVRGRMEHADSLLRVNDALRDLFDQFVLTPTAGGVEVLPVLSVAAVERILARPEMWPHEITATVAGWPAEVVDREAMIHERFAALLERDPEEAAALVERLHARLESHDGTSATADQIRLLLTVEQTPVEVVEALRADPEGAELCVGPPALLATGDERITPPLRPIQAACAEVTNAHG